MLLKKIFERIKYPKNLGTIHRPNLLLNGVLQGAWLHICLHLKNKFSGNQRRNERHRYSRLLGAGVFHVTDNTNDLERGILRWLRGLQCKRLPQSPFPLVESFHLKLLADRVPIPKEVVSQSLIDDRHELVRLYVLAGEPPALDQTQAQSLC